MTEKNVSARLRQVLEVGVKCRCTREDQCVARLDGRFGQRQLQYPIPQRLGQPLGRARTGEVRQPSQVLFGIAPPPGHHRRLDAADPRGDLFTWYPVAGEEHDPGPLHHLGRRALAPRPSLQLPPIGLGDVNGPRMSGHGESVHRDR